MFRAPISVEIPLCIRRSSSSEYNYDGGKNSIASYMREAHLLVNGRVVCIAKGQIDLFSSECVVRNKAILTASKILIDN